jgi:hypothetical protein
LMAIELWEKFEEIRKGVTRGNEGTSTMVGVEEI